MSTGEAELWLLCFCFRRWVLKLWNCVFSSADSPLLWIRIDPDMSVLRKVEFEQADFMWQYELRYERDVVAQQESILALEKFPTPASRLALTDILEQEQCFYRVRMAACFCLAKVRLHRRQEDCLWLLCALHRGSEDELKLNWVFNFFLVTVPWKSLYQMLLTALI